MSRPAPLSALTDDERRAILLRDKYHCTGTVEHWRTGEKRRCPMVGSEMLVRNGRTYCPRHAPEEGE